VDKFVIAGSIGGRAVDRSCTVGWLAVERVGVVVGGTTQRGLTGALELRCGAVAVDDDNVAALPPVTEELDVPGFTAVALFSFPSLSMALADGGTITVAALTTLSMADCLLPKCEPLFANNPLFSTPNFIGVGDDHGGIELILLGRDDEEDEPAEGTIGAVAVVRGRA